MEKLQQEQEFFTKPEDFSLQEYQPESNRTVMIHLLFPPILHIKLLNHDIFL